MHISELAFTTMTRATAGVEAANGEETEAGEEGMEGGRSPQSCANEIKRCEETVSPAMRHACTPFTGF